MTLPSGLGAQIGFGEESAYGDYQAPTRFLEFMSEAIKADVGRIQSFGLRRRRFLPAPRDKVYIRGAAGAIEMDVMSKGFGLIFEHMLGDHSVAGENADKTHTIVPDAEGLVGKSLTVQVGRPDIEGTAQPFSYIGGKVKTWDLKCQVDQALKLSLDMDFMTVVTDEDLEEASYASADEVLIFTEGALTVGGNAKDVKAVSIKGTNALAFDRRFLGNLKREPLPNAEFLIEGNLDCEFEDEADYEAFIAGQDAALVLAFTTGTTIPTTNPGVPFSLTVTIPVIKYTGDTPVVGGPGVVPQPLPFKAFLPSASPIITFSYVTSDTAA